MRRSIIALSMALAGCTGSVPIDHEDHPIGDPDAVDLGADPWRGRRRMDIDQLDSSIRTATGGIGWESWRRSGETWEVGTRYFDTYADTLGVPDYINGTSEDRSVSLLFQKFLDDAARNVCRRLADREGGSGTAYDGEPQAVFAPVDVNATDAAPAEVDAALSSLLLRFHGRRVELASDELTPWHDLYVRLAATEVATETPRRAWEGVCVALITHPDFYTY